MHLVMPFFIERMEFYFVNGQNYTWSVVKRTSSQHGVKWQHMLCYFTKIDAKTEISFGISRCVCMCIYFHFLIFSYSFLAISISSLLNWFLSPYKLQRPFRGRSRPTVGWYGDVSHFHDGIQFHFVHFIFFTHTNTDTNIHELFFTHYTPNGDTLSTIYRQKILEPFKVLFRNELYDRSET